MIHSFSCKNFYSFAEKNSVSFVVNEKAPKNDGYFLTDLNFRLSKALAVIGPNASGKTNLLKPLPFLKWLIVDAFIRIKPDAKIPIKPFLFGNFKNKPSELSVEFEFGADLYKYTFVLNTEKILEEELKIKNKSEKKTTFKKVFLREWDNENNNYHFFANKTLHFPKDFFEGKLRTNASVIAQAVQYEHEFSKKLNSYWQKVQTNVREEGRVDENVSLTFEALDFFIENKKLKQKAEKFLMKFDFGLKELDIQKNTIEEKIVLKASGIHTFDHKDYPLSFQYESEGTKTFLVLLKSILQVLNKGGIAVLDAFEANLHPDMVAALLKLFVSPETNSHNAQIIFSTHGHLVLSDLDKYQIVLVEKNKNGISEAWRLDEMSGVRADDNYYNKYIAGAYGAIPKIN